MVDRRFSHRHICPVTEKRIVSQAIIYKARKDLSSRAHAAQSMLTVQTEGPYINLSCKVLTTVIANKVHSEPKCAHPTSIRHFESRMRRRGSVSVYVRSCIYRGVLEGDRQFYMSVERH